MIKTFADQHTRVLFETDRSRRLPSDIIGRAIRKLELADLASSLDDLRVPPGNRLHDLLGDRVGQHSVSINDQWRVCFRFANGDAYDVEARTTIERRTYMGTRDAMKRTIRPTHPGEMLREDFMPRYRLTVAGMARALAVSRRTVNELLRERRASSPEMALRLARLFGNSPEFWLNAQRAVDLWEAEQSIGTEVERIQPLRVA